MKEPRLYLESGYINLPFMLSFGCPFIVMIGPRGTGKTYTILDYYREKGELILYMRRSQTAIDSASTRDLNPYVPINNDKQCAIVPKPTKDYTIFYNSHIEYVEDKKGENVEPIEVLDDKVALGMAFSTFYNKRSLSGEGINTVFFDEVIREPLEKRIKGEGKAFLNMYETLNRNRELKGQKPVQCILAGNSDSLDSEILQSIGAIEVIEKMYAENKYVYVNRDRGLAVFLLTESPIAAKKKDTALYRIANNKEFTDMATNNVFTDLRDSNDVKSMPLNEYTPLFSLNKRLTVYQHKSNDTIYVTRKKSGSPLNINMNYKDDKLLYKQQFAHLLIYKRIMKEIFYDSYDTKVDFNHILE